MRYSALGWTVDRFGPLFALPNEHKLRVGDLRTGRLFKEFIPYADSVRDGSAISSAWELWFGISFKGGGVFCHRLRSGELLWNAEVPDAETCYINITNNTLEVLTSNNEIVSLDSLTGLIVNKQVSVQNVHVLDADGNRLVQTTSSDIVANVGDQDIDVGDVLQRGESDRIMGAALGRGVLAVSWLHGGTSHLNLNGDLPALCPVNSNGVWMSEMIWNEQEAKFFGFGSLDIAAKGEALPIGIDWDGRNPCNLLSRLPGQIEYSRGQFCNNGMNAILESGSLWDIRSGIESTLDIHND